VIPVIIAVSFIVFALVDMAPGDIVDILSAGAGVLTVEEIAEMRAQYNLDRSMLYRYGVYMANLLQGDLGISYTTRTGVWELYISRLPNTLMLAFSGLLIGVAASIPLGILAARRAGTITDNVTTVDVVLGISMPSFWLALLLLQLFSLRLGWLPEEGWPGGARSCSRL
jgi:peptide/nickel transport system permease protein